MVAKTIPLAGKGGDEVTYGPGIAGADPSIGAGGGTTRADRVRRLVRYTGVNLASLAVDYAVFFSLTHALAMPVVASMAGYAGAFRAASCSRAMARTRASGGCLPSSWRRACSGFC